MKTTAIVLSLVLVTTATQATPLDVVEVGAPAINCVYAADCTAPAYDTVGLFTPPAASGSGRLQSRLTDPGGSGTAAAGLHIYQYRIDMRSVTGITALPCVHTMAIDFGPIVALDYDGNGKKEISIFSVKLGLWGYVKMFLAHRLKVHVHIFMLDENQRYPLAPTLTDSYSVKIDLSREFDIPIYRVADFNGDGIKVCVGRIILVGVFGIARISDSADLS